LRAPLRHIAGYVGILQTEASDSSTRVRAHLQTVADSAKNLGELIDACSPFRAWPLGMRRQRVSLPSSSRKPAAKCGAT